MALAGTLIFMKNQDVPGVIGHVGTVLGRNRINIANFSLGRRDEPTAPGQPLDAVALVSTDGLVPESVLAQLREHPAVKFARAAVPSSSKYMKPSLTPKNPCFSSGPCAKRPGWTLDALKDAAVGRSHRAKIGKNKLAEVIERSKKLLGMPEGYILGIVPASDTGAVEMALWSLLGERGVDVFSWESFGAGWAADCKKQLKLKDLRLFQADYGKLPDLQPGGLEPRRGVPVERDHFGSARSEWGLDRGRSRGSIDLRCHFGGLRDGRAVGQAGRGDLVLAEGAGRRGRARHARAQSACGQAAGRIRARSPAA